MNAVALIHGRIGYHAIKEKGIKGDIMFGRETGIDGVEAIGIFTAKITRGLHSGQQHGYFFRPQTSKHIVEIALRLGGIKAAQGVIGPQFENDDFRILGQGPVQPGTPARRGVAGYSGIGDFDGIARFAQNLFQLNGKSVSRGEVVASGKTIAEGQNAYRLQGHAPFAAPCIDNQGQQSISEEGLNFTKEFHD